MCLFSSIFKFVFKISYIYLITSNWTKSNLTPEYSAELADLNISNANISWCSNTFWYISAHFCYLSSSSTSGLRQASGKFGWESLSSNPKTIFSGFLQSIYFCNLLLNCYGICFATEFLVLSFRKSILSKQGVGESKSIQYTW